MSDPLSLSHWRRLVAEIYADVRRAPKAGRKLAWQDWRAARNDLLKNHPQSPLDHTQRRQFRGLPYFEYDPDWRVVGVLNNEEPGSTIEIHLGDDGQIQLFPIGRVDFTVKGIRASLDAYWIGGYGGGLFIPFLDKTNGITTFGGGRYLYDTIKSADLGSDGSELNMDFNYSYNPSCAYDSRWICPLAPQENTLSFPVTAGEKFRR